MKIPPDLTSWRPVQLPPACPSSLTSLFCKVLPVASFPLLSKALPLGEPPPLRAALPKDGSQTERVDPCRPPPLRHWLLQGLNLTGHPWELSASVP